MTFFSISSQWLMGSRYEAVLSFTITLNNAAIYRKKDIVSVATLWLWNYMRQKLYCPLWLYVFTVWNIFLFIYFSINFEKCFLKDTLNLEFLLWYPGWERVIPVYVPTGDINMANLLGRVGQATCPRCESDCVRRPVAPSPHPGTSTGRRFC